MTIKNDIYEPEYVKNLFNRVSETYGLTNYIASFGFTERWRRQCLDNLTTLKNNAIGIDLMCGRGETWIQLFKKHPNILALSGLDISPEMIKGANEQTKKLELNKVSLLEIDVFKNTIPDNSADFVISTFGVKTFNLEQQEKLAKEVHRILKNDGQFSFVEVSYPKGWFLARLYLFYLKKVMPIIEKVFLKYSYGFSMIGVYVERFGDSESLCSYFKSTGLDVTYHKFFFGCATGISGRKTLNAESIENQD